YPADGGDDGDDEMDIEEDEDDDMDIDTDKEDEDDEMDVEVDEEAEEDYPAPAYPVVVALPTTAPSAEETKPFKTDESAATPPPHPAYRMTARITIPEPLLTSTDVVKYNQRFQELALLCVRMFPEESDKIERYVGGLPDMIHGNIVASKPRTMQEAIEMATELMDKRVSTIAERQAENKRKFENTSRNNQNQQQQQNKRQNTGQAYTAGNSDRKSYAGLAFWLRIVEADLQMLTTTTATTTTIIRFKRNCPKLKNNDRGNQAGNDRAPAK
ncbi:hypothetical protein Tco_0042670, partial [Tanacetum coccineum]